MLVAARFFIILPSIILPIVHRLFVSRTYVDSLTISRSAAAGRRRRFNIRGIDHWTAHQKRASLRRRCLGIFGVK